MSGKVYFIGAGPGHYELLTIKAARLLRAADVVLHDDLVGNDILRSVPSSAQIYNVGKRCGNRHTTQDEIHALLVSFANAGKQVVRLKGGDPSIFGRLGEEISALREAGIVFEIVPGVSAALGAAAAAQVSLTHRDISHAVIFVTAHLASESDSTDWNALVASRATLVVYMPGYPYSQLAQKLTTAGLSEETPCLIVSRATTQDERLFRTTVECLAEAPRLAPPAVLVIGEVVQPSVVQQVRRLTIARILENPSVFATE